MPCISEFLRLNSGLVLRLLFFLTFVRFPVGLVQHVLSEHVSVLFLNELAKVTHECQNESKLLAPVSQPRYEW